MILLIYLTIIFLLILTHIKYYKMIIEEIEEGGDKDV